MSLSFIVVVSFSSPSHLSGLQVSDGSAWGWWGVNGHNQGITIAPNPKDNSPCWDSPTPKLPFTFSMYPNRLAQCEQTRIYWNPGEIQG